MGCSGAISHRLEHDLVIIFQNAAHTLSRMGEKSTLREHVSKYASFHPFILSGAYPVQGCEDLERMVADFRREADKGPAPGRKSITEPTQLFHFAEFPLLEFPSHLHQSMANVPRHHSQNPNGKHAKLQISWNIWPLQYSYRK